MSTTITVGLGVLAWALVSLDAAAARGWLPVAMMFLALFVGSELFPIRIPGRTELGELTLSVVFGFALLMVVPFQAALLAIAVGTLLGDLLTRTRKPFVRVLFNASQILLSFGLAGLVFVAERGSFAVPAPTALTGRQLALLIPAGLLMYAVNALLADTAIALDHAVALRMVLRGNIVAFDLLVHVLLIMVSPVVVLMWRESPWFTPFFLAAVFATYRAMQAAVDSRHELHHDMVTGLPNRRLLDERLSRLHRGDSAEDVALLALDLDGFHTINDTFGYDAGDRLLAAVADRLRLLRPVDLVARIGGVEFAVVIRGRLRSSDLIRIGSQLREDLIARPYSIDGVPLHVGASIGAALLCHGEPVQNLVARADAAAFEAKRAGEPIVVAPPGSSAPGPGRLSLVMELEQALEDGQLRLVYQPKFALGSGAVVGLEALLRWDHPKHGTIAPDRFIPAAEHTDLLPRLTRHVVRLALEDDRQRRQHGICLPVAVNISARDLQDHRLPRDVADLLAVSELPPSDLTLEVTESALLIEPERALQVLRELAELGISLSVDDFGTGYASLARLRDHPFSEVKIDRSFVSGMRDGTAGSVIVRSVIELGRSLDMIVVAEGIEGLADLQQLQKLGCGIGQGFGLVRPLNACRLERFLGTNTLAIVEGVTDHHGPIIDLEALAAGAA